METTWTAVDDYFSARLIDDDAPLAAAIADSTNAGLPPIAVTPLQGAFLAMLVQMLNARRVLELGTLGGYSAIWMARALARDGELLTLEINAGHAAVAQRNIDRANVADRVHIIVAPAATTLTHLIADRVEPFDLIFIDADKQSSDVYFKAALQLSHPGTLIVIDNVVRDGAVADLSSTDANVQGIQRMTDLVANEPRVSATVLQTVGAKAYDGFMIVRVTEVGGRAPARS